MMKKNRILLVDDEMDFLKPLSKVFERHGLDVETADRCLAALDKIGSGHFDVIIMDVKMPEIDGIQCLSMIKKEWPAIEVIILTGHASVSLGIKGMENGAFDYCVKPIDNQELLDKVKIACR